MPRRPELLGPLFREELHRLGRRGSFFQLRTAVPLLLLLALYANYQNTVSANIKAQEDLAQALFGWVLAAQMAAVWFLTPLFAAAVLTEERERKTLDLLLTTTLTAWDLVVGKLAARLTFVGGVLLAGLPVFGVLLLFGGLDPLAVAAAYGVTLLNLWSVGGVTAGLAAYSPSYRAALFWAWGLSVFMAMLPIVGPVHAVRVLVEGDIHPLGYAVYAGLHLAVGALGVWLAAQNVRPWAVQLPTAAPLPRARPPQAKPVYVREPTGSAPREGTKAAGVPLDFSWRSPPGPCDGPTADQLTGAVFLLAVAVGGLVGLALTDRTFPPVEYPLYMGMGWIPAGVITAAAAAGCVSREREGDTLTTLLTVPPGRAEILWRKWHAAAMRMTWLWLLTLGIGTLCLLPADDGVYWIPGFAAVGACTWAASTSAAVFFSVSCTSTFLSQAASVLAVLALGVFPGWWAAIVSDGGGAVGFVPVQVVGLAVVGWAGWRLAESGFHGYAKG